MAAQPSPNLPLRPQFLAQCSLPPEHAEAIYALVLRIQSYYRVSGRSRTPAKPSTREAIGILVVLGLEAFESTTLGKEILRFEQASTNFNSEVTRVRKTSRRGNSKTRG